MNAISGFAVSAALALACAADVASACRITVTVMGPNGPVTYTMIRPSKSHGTGMAPPGGFGGPAMGAPFGGGIPLVALGGFGDGVLKFDATTPTLPVDDPTNPRRFFLDFNQREASLMFTSGLMVTFAQGSLSGSYRLAVTEGDDPGGANDTFAAVGAFAMMGTGMGSDGLTYTLNFSALALSGQFGSALFVNGTHPGDPMIDILHPVPTQTFSGVMASLMAPGGMSATQQYGSLTCAGYTTCGEMMIPAPGAGVVLAGGMLAMGRRRRG